MGRIHLVWPLLRHSPDPRVRSYIIHRLSLLGVDARNVVKRLNEEQDVSARRALLLSLGEYDETQLAGPERTALLPILLDWYRDDADAGVHGAVAWLLRRWGHKDELQKIDAELATGKVEGARHWYVNSQGQTFTVIPGPVEFRMGSPETEQWRDRSRVESLRVRKIAHTFAIAATEVTVDQFLRFRKNHEYDRHAAPRADCPVSNVNWYDAAEFCNWLSAQEGISAEQWCYEPNADETYAAVCSSSQMGLCGYRLPSESRMGVPCRSGA
jgi:hypothetical protein